MFDWQLPRWWNLRGSQKPYPRSRESTISYSCKWDILFRRFTLPLTCHFCTGNNKMYNQNILEHLFIWSTDGSLGFSPITLQRIDCRALYLELCSSLWVTPMDSVITPKQMMPLIQWTWVWASSGSWWWTGKPGVLQSMGFQRVGHDWMTELNWILHVS